MNTSVNPNGQMPASTPQMPPLGDQQFDQKARIFEAWQRDRDNAARVELAAAQRAGAAAAAALTNDARLVQAQRRDEVLRLIATMTSAQRAKPAQAVAAALATIAAIDAALAGQ